MFYLVTCHLFLNKVFRDSRILLEQVGVGGQSRELVFQTQTFFHKNTLVCPKLLFFFFYSFLHKIKLLLLTNRVFLPSLNLSLAIRQDLFLLYRELLFSIVAGFATC